MILSTRSKIALARVAFLPVMAFKRLIGQSALTTAKRRGVSWSLNLGEGIDFSIYFLGIFEPTTVAAYQGLLSEGDIVIDIGANMGAHTLHLAQAVGESGRVLAFEPTLEAFSRLQKNIELNTDLSARIKADQVMLVADDTDPLETAFYSSWPLERHPDAHAQHLGVAKSTQGARPITLDSALSQAQVDRVDLIKLDVDGFELDILRGAQQTLDNFGPKIIMELCPYVLEERGQNLEQLTNFLLDRGYRFADLKGKPFQNEGVQVPDIPKGSSINVIASRQVVL